MVVQGVRPLETSDSEIGQSDMEAMKPTVKMALEDVRNAEIGKPARLDCVIVGVPEPEVHPNAEYDLSWLYLQYNNLHALFARLFGTMTVSR